MRPPFATVDLEDFYANACRQKRLGITRHLPRLRQLASGLDLACEFGVRRGASTSALLMGARRVLSWDVEEIPSVTAAILLAAGNRWVFTVGDSKIADVPTCDLLFIDSKHTYAQCDAELLAHADRVQRLIALHDTVTYGPIGSDGGPGLLRAVDNLIKRDPSWRIVTHYRDSHGLMILQRT